MPTYHIYSNPLLNFQVNHPEVHLQAIQHTQDTYLCICCWYAIYLILINATYFLHCCHLADDPACHLIDCWIWQPTSLCCYPSLHLQAQLLKIILIVMYFYNMKTVLCSKHMKQNRSLIQIISEILKANVLMERYFLVIGVLYN